MLTSGIIGAAHNVQSITHIHGKNYHVARLVWAGIRAVCGGYNDPIFSDYPLHSMTITIHTNGDHVQSLNGDSKFGRQSVVAISNVTDETIEHESFAAFKDHVGCGIGAEPNSSICYNIKLT